MKASGGLKRCKKLWSRLSNRQTHVPCLLSTWFPDPARRPLLACDRIHGTELRGATCRIRAEYKPDDNGGAHGEECGRHPQDRIDGSARPLPKHEGPRTRDHQATEEAKYAAHPGHCH